jgi:hypothetical protein
MSSGAERDGEKACPCCGNNVYDSSFNGTRVYKCASPVSECRWNRQWHEAKGGDEYRIPLGRTAAQVRRVNAEFCHQS